MVFHSFSYLLFFPIVLLVTYLLPKKARYIWLLAASYFFYGCADTRYVFLLASITLLAYVSGLLLEKTALSHRTGLTRAVFLVSVTANLGILCYFKYTNFLLESINALMNILKTGKQLALVDGLLSIGISFIIFQSISYSADIYRGTLTAEKNLFKFAFYLAFFPKLISGPIERAGNFLKQLETPPGFSLQNFKEGLSLILMGLFYKLVLSDNIASIINPVFASFNDYSGIQILLAVALFAFQIYGDFGGYSLIAIGSASILGFRLSDNFHSPFHSESVSEFWRRWHITLNDWLRDYIYIPLGGSRKGSARKYLNTMLVFLASGLWHGAGLHYILWGGLNGLFILCENLYARFIKPGNKSCLPASQPLSTSWRHRITVFVLTGFAWLFFRMPDIKSAFLMIYHAVTAPGIRSLFNLGFLSIFPDTASLVIVLAALFIMLWADTVTYRSQISFQRFFFSQTSAFRWIFGILILYMIIFYGAYGESYEQTQFIYFQF